jgi:hypothetical protein
MSLVGAILRFAASKGLVSLDEFPFAAERAWIDLPHCLPDPVRHKPSGLVGNAKGAM